MRRQNYAAAFLAVPAVPDLDTDRVADPTSDLFPPRFDLCEAVCEALRECHADESVRCELADEKKWRLTLDRAWERRNDF